jgi:hypothetical protein
VKLIDRRTAATTAGILSLLLVGAWFGANACAYEVETHADISEAVATSSKITSRGSAHRAPSGPSLSGPHRAAAPLHRSTSRVRGGY